MAQSSKRHVIAIVIDNEFGALARVVELFSARGYNIESLSVAPVSSDKKLSRITVTTYGSDETIELICKLLNRIVPVHIAAELSKNEAYLEMELALAQVVADDSGLKLACEALQKFRYEIIDREEDSSVFEIIGSAADIDRALKILADFGLSTVSRTGIAAGFRGKRMLLRQEF